MAALQEIEKEAMHLSHSERALLAEHLIASIVPGEDIDAEALWVTEAESRYEAYQAGKLNATSAEEVFQQAAKHLK